MHYVALPEGLWIEIRQVLHQAKALVGYE
jgi:hypothetical protein